MEYKDCMCSMKLMRMAVAALDFIISDKEGDRDNNVAINHGSLLNEVQNRCRLEGLPSDKSPTQARSCTIVKRHFRYASVCATKRR